MIAYKATNTGKCRDITYEIGKTYTFNGEIEICERGFHFHKNLFDIYNYYSKEDNTKIFEIEVLGDIITEGDKSVTNKLKILREISTAGMILEKDGKVKEYDENNNLIKFKDSNGYWRKYTYDENNNLIKYEDSNGFWRKYTYDENNNKVKFEDSYDYWEKFKYDENNNLIKFEDSYDYWEKFKYDENNNLIKFEDSNGFWKKWEYEKNNLVYSEDSDENKYYIAIE